MLRKLGCLVFVAALSAGVAFAQSTFGTLLGTVTDQSGAVIAKASVKITNTEEGASRTVETDKEGNFDAVNSKAGHYLVEVSSDGFKTVAVPNLELAARQTLRVDVVLQVGSASQKLEVTAAPETIDTETETVS